MRCEYLVGNALHRVSGDYSGFPIGGVAMRLVLSNQGGLRPCGGPPVIRSGPAVH